MNIRTLLIGVFGASAAVLAYGQSSVTLYGLLDVGGATFDRTATSTSRLNKLNSDTGSSSRWGVRGTEDLGSGVSVFFNLESPIDMKNGVAGGGASSGACNAAAGCATATAPSFWRRNAVVGLKGAFGQVALGRYGTAAIAKQGGVISATPSGINTGFGLAVLSQGIGNDFWNSNQIRYDSPKLGGFDFALSVAAGEGLSGRNLGGNVRYMQGPIAVSLSVQKDEDLAGKSVTWTMLSGSYDFGTFKLHAGADKMDNSNGVVGFVHSSLWTLGGSFKATPALTLAAQYWAVKEKVGPSSTSKLVVLNAFYALSKRTSLYALAGFVDNKDLGLSPLWGNGNFGGSGNVIVTNAKNNGLALGIRHLF
ncbi:porin [Piscinibacter sakaiensis]|uniref:porin n=1 Tax=Piscinibacter sakaiensis TaxID=1547922 RepID=UPI003AAEC1CB